jgi:hypothetical protein
MRTTIVSFHHVKAAVLSSRCEKSTRYEKSFLIFYQGLGMQRQYGSKVAPPHFYKFQARVARSTDTDADADEDGGHVLGGAGGKVLGTFTYFIFGVSEKDRDTSQLESQVPTLVLLHVLGI